MVRMICDKYHSRTIGPKGGIRKTWRVSLYAIGAVTRSRSPLKGIYSMKRSLLIFVVLIAIATAGVQPAAAQNRYIVRTTGGLGSVLNLCSLLGCQVQGSLDGNINQTFLVTSSGNIIVNLLNFTVNLVDSLLGIQSIEPDKLLPVPQTPLNSISSGLS